MVFPRILAPAHAKQQLCAVTILSKILLSHISRHEHSTQQCLGHISIKNIFRGLGFKVIDSCFEHIGCFHLHLTRFAIMNGRNGSHLSFQPPAKSYSQPLMVNDDDSAQVWRLEGWDGGGGSVAIHTRAEKRRVHDVCFSSSNIEVNVF